MSCLICIDCKQIPYVQFIPGLHVKIICCKELIILPKDIDKIIEKNFTLSCQNSSCTGKNSQINYFSKKLLCDICLKKSSAKNYIQSELIPNTCLEHNKKYQYYEPQQHKLFCDYCNLPKSVISVEDYKKEIKTQSIDISENSLDIIPYFSTLAKRIIQTYKTSKKKTGPFLNSYLNLLNLKIFLDEYPIISPFCQNCKKLYNISIQEKAESNILISCDCGIYSYSSVNELENKIDSIACDECKNNFHQKEMYFDFLSEDILCEKCLNKRNTFDFLRFNEIAYICDIHKKKYYFLCENCGKYLCEECKNLENHKLIRISKDKDLDNKIPILNGLKWFEKIKNDGFLNLKSQRNICSNTHKNISDEITNFKIKIEKKNNNNLKVLSDEFKEDLLTYFQSMKSLCIKIMNFLLEEKIVDLENKVSKLEFSNDILFKQFSDKNRIAQFLKSRNILQHLLTNMIMKKYDCFENIEGDFRILYESYKYLNYDKKKNDELKKKLESIFEKAENLIKNTIKRNVKDHICSLFFKDTENQESKIGIDKLKKYFYSSDNEKKNFDKIINDFKPKLPFNKKLEMFNRVFASDTKKAADKIKFDTIYNYNKHLKDINCISEKSKKKNDDLISRIKEIENNEIPEDFDRKKLYKDLDFKENDYLDKFGYINEKTINKNLIAEIFENFQKDENHQYLILKKEKEKEFLDTVGCQNDIEFYFIYILANNLINRIGKIVHENDILFQFLFYDINDNLDINNYSLIRDKEKNELKFDFDESLRINNLKVLNQKEYKASSLKKFVEDFIQINIPKIIDLLGEKRINEIKKEIESKFPYINHIDKIKSEVNSFENKIGKYILFINECKDLFELFPKLKSNIINIVGNYDEPKLFALENKICYTENNNENIFINMLSNMYALTIYLIRNTKYIINEFMKKNKKFDELCNKYLKLELSETIFKLFETKIYSDKTVIDFFDEEKKRTIATFNNVFFKEDTENFPEEIKQMTSGELEIFKKMQNESKLLIENVIKKMKDINREDIGKKFKKYSDYEINTFAYSKLDVILFLCQNKYI